MRHTPCAPPSAQASEKAGTRSASLPSICSISASAVNSARKRARGAKSSPVAPVASHHGRRRGAASGSGRASARPATRSAAPLRRGRPAAAASSTLRLPSGSMSSTPAPCNTANQRSTPGKAEKGPSARMSATLMRKAQSSRDGQASSSRVSPPPLRQGCGSTASSAPGSSCFPQHREQRVVERRAGRQPLGQNAGEVTQLRGAWRMSSPRKRTENTRRRRSPSTPAAACSASMWKHTTSPGSSSQPRIDCRACLRCRAGRPGCLRETTSPVVHEAARHQPRPAVRAGHELQRRMPAHRVHGDPHAAFISPSTL
jgi:hypothetical protein